MEQPLFELGPMVTELGPIVTACLSGMAGLGMFYLAWRSLLRLGRAATWPTAPGRIIHSTCAMETDQDGPNYTVDIAYVFQANGRQYSGSSVCPGGMSIWLGSTASRILRRYPKDQGVHVRYDPSDPAECYLELSFDWISYGTMGLAGLSLIMLQTYHCMVALLDG